MKSPFIEFPCLSALFGLGRRFMTTFLIHAAALLVSFIVLVVVAFVYVIMSEDDKNDQHKN